MAIKSDPGCCCRATDSDMALRSSPGLDVTMTSGGSAGHADQHGPHGSMTLRHLCSQVVLRLQASVQPSVVQEPQTLTQAALVIGYSPGRTSPWTRVVSRPFMSVRSSHPHPCRSTSLPSPGSILPLSLPFLHPALTHHNGAWPPGTRNSWLSPACPSQKA